MAGGGASAAAGGSGQVKVGLVLEQPLIGRSSDPFQYGAYRGLVRAKRELHIQAKAVAPDPTPGLADFAAPMSYLALHRYNLVITVGFDELRALSQVAPKFRHVKFGLLDATYEDVKPPSTNVEGTEFHTEQASYLAGFLAARMVDRRPGPHVVSSVGGPPIPPVLAYIAGFEAGAKHADPKIRVLHTFTNNFLQKKPCYNAALDQIAHGSRAVFDVAGACGLGALEAAKQKGVYGIGVDIDQSGLGPFILTSVVKNLDVAVYDLAKRAAEGRLRTGGDLTFTLRNHGVKLGRFSPHVPLSLRHELIPLKRQIEQGKIFVPTTISLSH